MHRSAGIDGFLTYICGIASATKGLSPRHLDEIAEDSLSFVLRHEAALQVRDSTVSLRTNTSMQEHALVLKALSEVPDDGEPWESFVKRLSESLPEEEKDLARQIALLFDHLFTVQSNGSDIERVVPRREDTNQYVRALRRVIHGAPSRGLEISEIPGLLEKLLVGEKRDAASFGFESVEQALGLLTDSFCLKKTRVIPVCWEAVMERVASRMPYEGMLQSAFSRLLTSECPDFSPKSMIGGLTLADWVQCHFRNIICVHLASDEKTPIFRAVPQFPLTLATSLVCALRNTKMRKVTEWVDLKTVLPCAEATTRFNKPQLLAALQCCGSSIDLKVDLAVREKQDRVRTAVFVDVSSGVDLAAAKTLLEKSIAFSLADAYPCCAIRREGDRDLADGDVVANSWLDPAFVVPAHISAHPKTFSEIAAVIIVCSDDAFSNYTDDATVDCILSGSVKSLTVVAPSKVATRKEKKGSQ